MKVGAGTISTAGQKSAATLIESHCLMNQSIETYEYVHIYIYTYI